MSNINLKVLKKNIGRLDITSTKKLLDEVKNNPQRYPPRISLRIYDIIGRILSRRLDVSNVKDLFPIPSGSGGGKSEVKEEEKPTGEQQAIEDGNKPANIEELSDVNEEHSGDTGDGLEDVLGEEVKITDSNVEEVKKKVADFFTKGSKKSVMKLMRIHQGKLKDLLNFDTQFQVNQRTKQTFFSKKSRGKLISHMNQNNVVILKDGKSTEE